MQWHTTVKQYKKNGIDGILDVKMSNERDDLPHPPEYNVSKFKKL